MLAARVVAVGRHAPDRIGRRRDAAAGIVGVVRGIARHRIRHAEKLPAAIPRAGDAMPVRILHEVDIPVARAENPAATIPFIEREDARVAPRQHAEIHARAALRAVAHFCKSAHDAPIRERAIARRAHREALAER